MTRIRTFYSGTRLDWSLRINFDLRGQPGRIRANSLINDWNNLGCTFTVLAVDYGHWFKLPIYQNWTLNWLKTDDVNRFENCRRHSTLRFWSLSLSTEHRIVASNVYETTVLTDERTGTERGTVFKDYRSPEILEHARSFSVKFYYTQTKYETVGVAEPFVN